MTTPTDLFAAIRQGDREAVRAILAQRPAAVAERDGQGAAPLHYATEQGDRARLYLRRFPTLREAVAADGIPLRLHARNSGNPEMATLFDEQ